MSDSQWTVGAGDAGVRLDKFLAAGGRLGSRPQASAAIDRGKVFVNGQEAGADAAAMRLAPGDVVRVWTDRPGTAKRRRVLGGPRGLEIVFEDEAIIVLNKPAGLLAVPLPRRGDAPSVYAELARYLPGRGQRPFVVHRIDRDTSGLVVFAKDAGAQEALKEQFKRREAERVYCAVVYGHPSPAAGTWRDRLVWDRAALVQKKAHAGDPRGAEAVSEYRVVEPLDGASLLEVRLVSGRRNQIRLQAKLRGHPLVGERRYVDDGDRLQTIAFPRQALHAQRLAFRHPLTSQPLAFEALLPDDLRRLIDRLRARRSR